MTRSSGPILLVFATLTVACAGERAVETPVITTLEVAPNSATIAQSEFADFAATLTRSAGVAGVVDFTVVGVPAGVTAVVSSLQTVGLVTTATIALNVASSATPGVYTLTVHGTEPGAMEATTTFVLTVAPSASCPAGGVVCQQWATDATASSEYTSTDWSARQATGEPNATSCQDDSRAWASVYPTGPEWLELTFQQAVRPTEIRIYEVFGVSSIVKVEVKDATGAYYTVYTAQPARQTCSRVLIVPVVGVSAIVNAVRLSFDQSTLNDWDEIDAVKLVGLR